MIRTTATIVLASAALLGARTPGNGVAIPVAVKS